MGARVAVLNARAAFHTRRRHLLASFLLEQPGASDECGGATPIEAALIIEATALADPSAHRQEGMTSTTPWRVSGESASKLGKTL